MTPRLRARLKAAGVAKFTASTTPDPCPKCGWLWCKHKKEERSRKQGMKSSAAKRPKKRRLAMKIGMFAVGDSVTKPYQGGLPSLGKRQ
jgi:ssDNA-binding Zn-finger/Zn-ribbon topoisomerase 1